MSFGLQNDAQTFQRLIRFFEAFHSATHTWRASWLLARTYMSISDTSVSLQPSARPRFLDKCIQVCPVCCVPGVSWSSSGSAGHSSSSIQSPGNPGVPQPHTQCELRQFLGLMNFYHRFVPGCASILQPLHNLLSLPLRRTPLSLDTGGHLCLHSHQRCPG